MAIKRINSFYLPQELVFKIFSYLPLISLLRFTAVCKSWRSIILNQHFIDSDETEAFLVLNQGDHIGRVAIEDQVYVDTREKSVRLQLPPPCNGMVLRIYSCDGIVCLADFYDDVIYLWNPLTRHLKKLPTPRTHGPSPLSEFGFVFDSTSNDYKLLKITLSISHYDRSVDEIISVLDVNLYSSNAGYWKDIDLPNAVQSLTIRSNSKCVHDLKTGVLYVEGTHEVLSFDLHNEVFEIYPFPSSVKHSRSNVLDFEGSVAMIFGSICDGSVLGLWTLDNVGDDKLSWYKKFNVEADLKIDWVVLYLGIGHFVAQNSVVGNVFYDYKKKDTKKFLSPAPSAGKFSSVIRYTESLVSLEGFELHE